MNGFYEASILCGVDANDPKLSLQLAKVKQDLQKVLSSGWLFQLKIRPVN